MPTFFFHSGMAGAPTNTNAAGSTLEIIRSCLVTGFNIKPVLSATVASGVMTLIYAAPHGYEDKVLMRLDGAAGGSIVRRVTVTGASALTIPAPEFADGAVAGTLSTRVAPADWEEPFSATNVGVFRSKVVGPGSTRFFYRVADTVSGSDPAMLRGYESMTDVNTGIGAFPTVAQVAGNGLPITRSSSGTIQPWVIVADGRTVYVCLANSSNIDGRNLFFGDESPFGSSDLFLGSAIGSTSLAQGGPPYRPRVAAGSGTSATGAVSSTFGAALMTYPSPIDGGMVFVRPILTRDTNSASALRGTLRGLMQCSANPVPAGVLHTIFSSVTGITGRVAVVRDGLSGGTLCVAFPIDEDWP